MPEPVRILLLADSHLGFDLPSRPRVDRRRRGHDFLANHAAALAPALAGEVDLVVHGGDVFDRSSVLPSVAYQALEPLRQVAARGVPVFIVPGNHERSEIPHARFVRHPRVHVFHEPQTVVAEVRGMRVALSGFPFERREVRFAFPQRLEATRWREAQADIRVLCMHHCFEGATVGPADYTFRTAADVIRAQDLPPGFAAVLSGHIHRHQVLTHDLRGRPLAAPVCYPGSIERTSTAEIGETKGYMILQVAPDEAMQWTFHPLPARLMIRTELAADGMTDAVFRDAIEHAIREAPRNAVLFLRITGRLTAVQATAIGARRLRELAPATMNVQVSVEGGFAGVRQPRGSREPLPAAPSAFERSA